MNMENKNMHLVTDLSTAEKVATRDGFGKGLVVLGGENPQVVALCADLTESTRINLFKDKFPDRFIQMGVAEQNMMSVAAGLASAGKVPFVSSYAAFNPGRNWDQLRVSVCYSELNVKIEGAHAGLTVGPDGATHQALEDIAITRCLPNMTVLVPADSTETEKATVAAGRMNGPVYIRVGREKASVVTTAGTPFQIGRAEIFRDGTDVCVIACGLMVVEALKAAEVLAAEKISVMVINNHTIKPIDRATIIAAAKKTGALVTAEEHQIMGGLGSAVAEVIVNEHPVPMEFVGVKDTFGESGKPDEVLKKYGCSSDAIVQSIKAVLKKKK